MFEKEEEKLKNFKKAYEDISIPTDSLDESILAGFQKAKMDKRRRIKKKRWFISMAAAAILIIGFFTSIRLSPALADYISTIPGMEKIVELIRHDKGMMTAIEHDYYQDIEVSEEKNGVEVVIDGAIADETGLVIFYSLHSDEKQEDLTIEEVTLRSMDGEELNFSSISYGYPHYSGEGEQSYTGNLEFFFQEPYKTREFKLDVEVVGDSYREEYSIPFKLTKEIQAKKEVELNKTIAIEGQRITFLEAIVYPLRVAVHIKLNPNNTKELFELQDLRLVDENGETWSKIKNGTASIEISDEERIIYLQSNYFHEPEELYLVLNKIQAVNKEEVNVIVDTEKQQILKQPKGNKLRNMKIIGNDIVFDFYTKEEFPYFIFRDIRDGNGSPLESRTGYSNGVDENGVTEIGVHIQELKEQLNPISLKLSFYPEWIEGEEKIKIK